MTATTEKRGPGRPSGLPKTGGRKKGVANKVTKDVRDCIMVRGKPVEFLADVCAGKKIRIGPQAGPAEPEFYYPSFRERVEAANALLPFVAPKMASIDQTIDQTVRDESFDADAVRTALLESLKDELKHAGETGPASSDAAANVEIRSHHIAEGAEDDALAASASEARRRSLENGAWIERVETPSGKEKWGVWDWHGGEPHAFHHSVDAALAHARRLPAKPEFKVEDEVDRVNFFD